MMNVVYKISVMVALCVAFWPALASAAPPTPKGKIVYTDDFSNPKHSGLEDNLAALDFQRGFHAPGVYHLKLLKNNDVHWVLFPNQSYGDFTLEMDLWDNSDDFGGDATQGLVFRATDASHFYAVFIDPRKGEYAIRELNGQAQWRDLVGWKASSLVKQKAEVNHLRVDAAGTTFVIYLNNEQMDTFQDGDLAKGGVGMIASNVDAVAPHMHFDNVKIYTTATVAGTPRPPLLPLAGPNSSTSPFAQTCIALLLLGMGICLRRRTRQAVPSRN